MRRTEIHFTSGSATMPCFWQAQHHMSVTPVNMIDTQQAAGLDIQHARALHFPIRLGTCIRLGMCTKMLESLGPVYTIGTGFHNRHAITRAAVKAYVPRCYMIPSMKCTEYCRASIQDTDLVAQTSAQMAHHYS